MDNSIIPYIIAGIAGVGGAYFLFKKDKKDKKKVMNILGGVLILIGVFFFTLQMGYLTSLIGLAPIGKVAIPYTNYSLTAAPTGGVSPTTGACVGVEDTTTTWSWVNKYTSAAGGGTHAYRTSSDGGITYNPSKTVSNAGTDTLSPGDVVQTLFGNGTDGTYYGVVSQETIPCKGTHTLSASAVANGTLTMKAYTEGGDQIDDVTYNETIGAGDAVNLKLELQGANKAGFPYGGILVVEMNGSTFDEEDTEITFSDLTVRKVGVPNVHAVTAVENKAIAFEISAIEGTALHTGSIYLKADDTNNPDNADDPVITFRPYDYFTNEDNGGTFEGPAVEDEDNAATFAHVTTETISLN